MRANVSTKESTLPASSMSDSEYGQFRDFLEQACGIVLGDNKQYLVASRLNPVLRHHEVESVSQLVGLLKQGRARDLQNQIIEAMTTNETSWFRDAHPYDTLRQQLLPALAKQRKSTIRIWSAACSSGQEPYSISMTVQEFMLSNPGALTGNVEIVATDISSEMLQIAERGCYDNLAMARGLSAERKQRYFKQKDDCWEIVPQIRSRIRFRPVNLLQSYALLGRFDVIFCRNVLIYFSSESKRDILNRMAHTLNPGGSLILGGSESISGLTDAFEMQRTPQGGAVYERKA